LPIPKYFIIEKVEAIGEKEKLLQEILSQMSPKESKVRFLNLKGNNKSNNKR
jgi:hypothetical protein